jgi:glycosyltransferase involved in cell wall biosynthesis
MSNPRFSIVVPTRNRPETLRHTLESIAAQPGDDFEVVVADNFSGPETRAIVDSLKVPALRYARTDEVVPMAENWERGLALCTGDYVTVLGDDDGLLPSTLPLARSILDLNPEVELLSWPPHTYWWPDTIVHWARNTLILSLADGAQEYQSRQVLEAYYRGTVGFDFIPMIYSAFHHRRIIEEAKRRHGGFFVPRATAPDISSGILGLHLSRNYVRCLRPLSIRGNSGKSNGTAQWARSLGAEQRRIYFEEERVGLRGMIHEALVPSPHLHIISASARLKCKEIYFPEDDGLVLDLVTVLRAMIDSLNFEPEAYEENLADVKALADKLDIELADSDIPPRQPVERRRDWGPTLQDMDNAALRINCDPIGVRDVAAAARLADSILPTVNGGLK